MSIRKHNQLINKVKSIVAKSNGVVARWYNIATNQWYLFGQYNNYLCLTENQLMETDVDAIVQKVANLLPSAPHAVNYFDFIIDGIDHQDYPDFCDAYILKAQVLLSDGTDREATDEELEMITEKYAGYINQYCHGVFHA